MAFYPELSISSDIASGRVGVSQVSVVMLRALLLIFGRYEIGAIGFAIPLVAAHWRVAPSAFTQAVAVGSPGMLFAALGMWSKSVERVLPRDDHEPQAVLNAVA